MFNCGYGNGFSVLDVVNTANKLYQNKINYSFAGRRDGDVEKLIAETTKIMKYIDWEPKYNDLKKLLIHQSNGKKKLMRQIHKRVFIRSDNKELYLYGYQEHKESAIQQLDLSNIIKPHEMESFKRRMGYIFIRKKR